MWQVLKRLASNKWRGGVVLFIALGIFAFIAFFCVTNNVDSSIPLRIGEQTLWLAVADTPEERVRGLSGRTTLAADRGMLFVFSDPGKYSFWMKDMAFPLDILWLSQGIVVEMVTLPAPLDHEHIPTYLPRHEADRIIELPAGRAKELGIATGTRLVLPRIEP